MIVTNILFVGQKCFYATCEKSYRFKNKLKTPFSFSLSLLPIFKQHKSKIHINKAEPHSDVSAVGGEVHLDDKAGDPLTVAAPVEGGARGQVVEVHTVFLRAHRQVLLVRAESTAQKNLCKFFPC